MKHRRSVRATAMTTRGCGRRTSTPPSASSSSS